MKNNSKTILGSFLVIFSLLITISIFSFINTWQEDQSLINDIFSSNDKVENIGNKIGFYVSYYLVYTGFGIGSLLICLNILILGLSLAFDRGLNKIINRSFTLLLSCIWISLFCGYFINNKIYSGVFGFEGKNLIINFSGDIGLILLLIFGFIVFMILVLKITPLKTYNFIKDFIEKIKISSKKSTDEY